MVFIINNFQNPEIQKKNPGTMFYHFAPTKHPFKVIINKRKVIHLQVTTDNKVHLRFA